MSGNNFGVSACEQLINVIVEDFRKSEFDSGEADVSQEAVVIGESGTFLQS